MVTSCSSTTMEDDLSPMRKSDQPPTAEILVKREESEMNLKIDMLAVILAAMMLMGCVMAPYPTDGSVIMAPPLPSVVWLDTGPYYYNGGYTYYYQNRVWHYSNHRDGPWRDLPRE